MSVFVSVRMQLVRAALACTGLLLPTLTASASGPVERLVQVLANPNQPDRIAVRYGLASEGFLFSSDGGKTFRAMCGGSIAPERTGTDRIRRLSEREVPATAATVMDGSGRILFALYGATFTDDGTGCAWSSVPELSDKWPFSMKRDPTDPNVVWAAVSTSTGDGADTMGRVDLMRRDASGKWSVVAPIRSFPRGQLVFDGDLLVAANGARLRYYVLMRVSGLNAADRWSVLSSDDAGRTWQERMLPAGQADLRLLTADPSDHRRLLAVEPKDGQLDNLLLSEDGGATFKKYAELRAVSDVGFAADGRIFIADAGDASSQESVGGLFTARRMGDPLTRLGEQTYVDCVAPMASGQLYLCSRDKFGVADPATGRFEERVRFESVPGLLECPGRDMQAVCETDLNQGSSWCCAGHYPFTPFCGEYDVTRTADGRRVFCGLSGQEYDKPSGSGAPTDDGGVGQADAGVRADAGDGEDQPTASGPRGSSRAKSGGGGCAVAIGEDDSAPLLGGLLLGLYAVLRRVRAQRRASAR